MPNFYWNNIITIWMFDDIDLHTDVGQMNDSE